MSLISPSFHLAPLATPEHLQLHFDSSDHDFEQEFHFDSFGDQDPESYSFIPEMTNQLESQPHDSHLKVVSPF